jgi:hypothetical protein
MSVLQAAELFDDSISRGTVPQMRREEVESMRKTDVHLSLWTVAMHDRDLALGERGSTALNPAPRRPAEYSYLRSGKESIPPHSPMLFDAATRVSRRGLQLHLVFTDRIS